MKPITWLRKFDKRGDQGYPVATLAFYGPDDKKASKAVLGIIPSKDAEVQLHKWFRESPDADLRYEIKLQNAWIEIIRPGRRPKPRDNRGNQRIIPLGSVCIFYPNRSGKDRCVRFLACLGAAAQSSGKSLSHLQ